MGTWILLLKNIRTFLKVLGKLKDFELTLNIGTPVPPAVQPRRKIPYNLSQKWIEKLIEPKENDIIENVESPTTLVSSLVIVPKHDGDIRIIVDMTVANQAIKREIHPVTSLEGIVQEMSGACHFSKLEMRSRYHQLEIDAAS